MPKLNLRDLYPDVYKEDVVITVSQEVAAVIQTYDRLEAAYRRRKYYHRAHYSLDRGDGIEREVSDRAATPHELFEQMETTQELYLALSALPSKQAKRVYARYVVGLSVCEIAQGEAVTPASVSESIRRGLRNLYATLKKMQEMP